MIALLAAAALACTVSAKGDLLEVDGQPYTLHGRDLEAAAVALEECGGDPEALLEWRRQVRRSWVSGVAGAAVVVPWLWTPRHIQRARYWRARVLASAAKPG